MSMANLLEKLNARDKDEKFMAMHDLAADLDKDAIKLDGEMERRVVAIILKHLEDSGTDVKQQAVRTIASLAKKVQEAQLEDIADKLATHMLNKTDEEKRDIGSIGLKTLVGVLTTQTAPAVLKRVTPKLQQGIAQEPEVVFNCRLLFCKEQVSRPDTLEFAGRSLLPGDFERLTQEFWLADVERSRINPECDSPYAFISGASYSKESCNVRSFLGHLCARAALRNFGWSHLHKHRSRTECRPDPNVHPNDRGDQQISRPSPWA